jgi:hypothetical protein
MSRNNFYLPTDASVDEKCTLLLNEDGEIPFTVNRNDLSLIAESEFSADPCDIAQHNFTEAVFLKQAIMSKNRGTTFLELTSKLKLNVPVFFGRVLELGGGIRIYYNPKNIRECVGIGFQEEFTNEYQKYYNEYLLPLENLPDFTDTAKIINVMCMP